MSVRCEPGDPACGPALGEGAEGGDVVAQEVDSLGDDLVEAFEEFQSRLGGAAVVDLGGESVEDLVEFGSEGVEVVGVDELLM